jgi:hypothetical protein
MENKIFYKFIKLDLAQFATFCCDNAVGDEPLVLSNSFKFSYNFDEEVVCCTTMIVVTKGDAPMLKAELNSYFKIQTESVKAITNDDSVSLPIELMTQFASLCYGSMRGVLYIKTIGTPLNDMVLPPSDIQNLFTSPATFKR